jgi:hypothetical protein
VRARRRGRALESQTKRLISRLQHLGSIASSSFESSLGDRPPRVLPRCDPGHTRSLQRWVDREMVDTRCGVDCFAADPCNRRGRNERPLGVFRRSSPVPARYARRLFLWHIPSGYTPSVVGSLPYPLDDLLPAVSLGASGLARRLLTPDRFTVVIALFGRCRLATHTSGRVRSPEICFDEERRSKSLACDHCWRQK